MKTLLVAVLAWWHRVNGCQKLEDVLKTYYVHPSAGGPRRQGMMYDGEGRGYVGTIEWDERTGYVVKSW